MVTLMAFLASTQGWCLGVSDIALSSKLGEPLVARLQLTDTGDLDKDQIIIRIASLDTYRLMGVDRSYETLSIKFDINDHRVVTLKTHDSIKEPYLNFILEILWPEGKLYREFKLFLDPV